VACRTFEGPLLVEVVGDEGLGGDEPHHEVGQDAAEGDVAIAQARGVVVAQVEPLVAVGRVTVVQFVEAVLEAEERHAAQ
jgi:hypothetical protein